MWSKHGEQRVEQARDMSGRHARFIAAGPTSKVGLQGDDMNGRIMFIAIIVS